MKIKVATRTLFICKAVKGQGKPVNYWSNKKAGIVAFFRFYSIIVIVAQNAALTK